MNDSNTRMLIFSLCVPPHPCWKTHARTCLVRSRYLNPSLIYVLLNCFHAIKKKEKKVEIESTIEISLFLKKKKNCSLIYMNCITLTTFPHFSLALSASKFIIWRINYLFESCGWNRSVTLIKYKLDAPYINHVSWYHLPRPCTETCCKEKKNNNTRSPLVMQMHMYIIITVKKIRTHALKS